ncbi:MAG: UDP-2,4-diacetamido-2,4,6-trideoxy-beta-L-altropyranose hydrolase [Chloroflexi bacterium]|nr:UDP-2,4-diacetamido-2,4,6-trideoxy-beta-L-altropyranose hydrolase [Chloroflexota bacterium]
MELGTGHVMRTQALATELRARGWTVVFAMDHLPGDLWADIGRAGFAVIAPGDVAESTAGKDPFDWVVVDHYGLDAAWHRSIRAAARRRLVIDDLADRPIAAEVLLDQNLDATSAKYRGRLEGRPRRLLGPRYALLRPEFAAARAAVRPVAPTVERIGVVMGGADATNVTALAVRASRHALPDAVIEVVLGPSYRHVPPAIDAGVVIHRMPPMAQLYASVDLAVAAGGTGALERCAMGVPTVTVRIADNQASVAEALARRGAAVDAGRTSDLDERMLADAIRRLAQDHAARAKMRDAGMALVDGRGVTRVVGVLDPIRLRPATPADRDRLLEWANDPITRANSVSTRKIGMAEHAAWLEARLASPDTEIVIGEDGRGPVGQVRLDLGPEGGEVSISVAPMARGGTGGALLAAAVRRWARRRPGLPLWARIRPDNVPSRRIFEGHGFRPAMERDGILYYQRPSDRARTAGRPEERSQ